MAYITLLALRISNGYTVDQVANHCGVSPKTINKYESDPAKLPLYLIIKLATLYRVDPNSIVMPHLIEGRIPHK